MSEKKVLTKEEIQSLKDLKVRFDQLVGVIGETEVQIMNLELRRDALKSNLIAIQEEEMKLGKEWGDALPILYTINRWKGYANITDFYIK